MPPTTAPINLVAIPLTELGFTTPEEVIETFSELDDSSNPEFFKSKGFSLLAPVGRWNTDDHKAIHGFVNAAEESSMLALMWSQQDESCYWALRRCVKGNDSMAYVRTPASVSMTDFIVLVKLP
jgi:hypothetical protein